MPIKQPSPTIGTVPDLENLELFDTSIINNNRLICQVRKSTNLLYRIFLELIRTAYSNDEGRPLGPPPLIWCPNVEETDIWIDTELAWSDQAPEFRPAIYVELGDIQYTSKTGRSDGLMGGFAQEAETFFSRDGAGTVNFRHIGATAQVACDLGDMTLDYLDAFSSVIRDDFCFDKFHVTSRSPCRHGKKESKERYISVVGVEYSFQDTWTLKLESQKLKSFVFRAGQRAMAGGIVVDR